MKKMFTTMGLILLICGIIAGMFSCWEMPEMQYGIIKVGFNLNTTKAITYDWDMVESGKVFLKQGGITKFEADITLDKTAKTGSCMLDAIPYGGYDIVVELYDTQGLIFYIGEDDVAIDHMDNGMVTIVLERNAGILSASGTWTEDIPGIYRAEMHLIQDDSMESSTNMSIDTGLKTVSGNIDNIYPGSYEINVLIKDQENNILFEGSTLYTIDKGDNIALLTLIFQTGSVEIQISGDVTAPAIEEPGPSYSVNGTNVTVTWTTNENATSNICWSETEGFDYKTQLNWAPVGRDIVADNTSHSVDITGLTEGNTYYYVVYTADESGNVRVSDEGSIVVAAVVFVSNRNGNNDIYTMNLDGSNVTRLTSRNSTLIGSPAYSPDGSKIVFEDAGADIDVYIMNSDGTNQSVISNLSGNIDSDAFFSPDGTKVVMYWSACCWQGEVVIQGIDGSDRRNIANNAAFDGSASFTPDGRVVFASNRTGTSQVFIMNADGSPQTNLSNNSFNDGSPSFSSDGSTIVFSSDRDGNYEIYRMNADGSGQTRLTNNPADDYVSSGGAILADGSKIVFYSNRDGNWEIYIMNIDGTSQTRLTDNSANDLSPSFWPYR